MAKIDLTIPSLGNQFIDLRDSLPGDAYNWSWTRPLSQVNYLAIHHTAGPDTQTPDQIANFHINSNGWGGIGYHFLIAKDGTVYYVGDISTARANVANLNDQVIGICLIGNFMGGKEPTTDQLDSTRKLCGFLINYPDLENVKSRETIKGHKELPGQSTACPGDSWSSWKNDLTLGQDPSLPTPNARRLDIAKLYRTVLGREPDESGLASYAQGSLTIDEIRRLMVSSEEHQKLLTSNQQVNNLQTSLALVNEQIINLQSTLQSREQEIQALKARLVVDTASQPGGTTDSQPKIDTTLTIFQALFNLYKFVFWPRKVI